MKLIISLTIAILLLMQSNINTLIFIIAYISIISELTNWHTINILLEIYCWPLYKI